MSSPCRGNFLSRGVDRTGLVIGAAVHKGAGNGVYVHAKAPQAPKKTTGTHAHKGAAGAENEVPVHATAPEAPKKSGTHAFNRTEMHAELYLSQR